MKIPHKIRLIKRNPHISSDSGEEAPPSINWIKIRRSLVSKRFCLYLLSRFVSLTLFWPFFSYAASLPMLSLPVINDDDSTFGAVKGETVANSQNVELLSPKVNNNQLKGSVGGGRVLVVDDSALAPEMGIVGTSLDVNQTQNNGKISIYEVREGDTLSQIAEMFDISANTIRWANDIKGQIKPGQILVILPVTGITHRVKNGGTIADIADIYDADVEEIALFNGIDVDKQLKPGDEVIVPNVDPAMKEGESGGNKPSSYAISYPSSAATSGYYINPVPGGILTQNIHGYNAVDIGAPVGTPIYAAASGRVIDSRYSGWNGGYGLMAIITHDNGTQTLYSHFSEVTTKIGQKVKQGDLIGYMGSTGKSTGSHLHFEVRGARNPLSKCRVGSVCSI